MGALFTISSRHKAQRSEEGGYILQYAMPIRIFGAAFLALGVTGTLLFVNKFANQGEDLIPLVLAATIVIGLLLSICIEFFYVSYSVNNDFICSQTPWSKKRSIYWKDVKNIYYSQSLRWFVIKDDKSKPIRVGVMVSGIDKLLEIVKNNTEEGIFQQLLENIEK